MRQLLGLLGAGAVLFATSVSQAQCAKDTDCKGDRVCEAGQCTAPVAPPASVAGPLVEPEPTPAPAEAEEPAPAPAVKMQRRSTGMMVGGIVMVSLAPVALIVAGFSGVLKLACSTSYNDRHCDDSYDPVIYGSLLSSVVLVGVGVPLLVVGAKRVPVATATIAPWATPRAAGLGLRIDM